MNQIKKEYYPLDKNDFNEISICFLGSRFNPIAIKIYLKLIALNKKLKIKYPYYITKNNSKAYGNFLMYNIKTILDNDEKKINIKIICNELLKVKMNNYLIFKIELIIYKGKKIQTYEINNIDELNKINIENSITSSQKIKYKGGIWN